MNRTWIELDREALAHNIRRYQSLLPAGCRIMGVVKADAYGHGARAVAAQLWELGIRHFATATLDEAVQLREAGIQGEILILGYSAPAYFHLLAEHGLTQTATCPDHAAQMETYCRENGVRLKVHIAVDTGMHRIGFLPEDLQPMPVMTLKARITSVREIGPGETVSYGRIFRAERPTKVASVSIGYADGIPRCLSGGKLRAIVRGQYAQGIGRICMDQLMLDVTGIEDVRVGDEAVFIGRQGDCVIYAEELAENAGTITNELFSRLGARVEGRCFRQEA